MLRSLHLSGVGPTSKLDLELAERLEVLTGDNGLGKSFVLEVAWWALTGGWTDRPVLPATNIQDPSMQFQALSRGGESTNIRANFERLTQTWHNPWALNHRAPNGHRVLLPESVLNSLPTVYVRANGGFSVWDPFRNLQDHTERATRRAIPAPFHFDSETLLNGIESQGKTICNGLIQDWVTWQLEARDNDEHPFHLLCEILSRLSHPEEPMAPGPPRKLYLDDVRKFPTIELPYGAIPVIHASAGMLRILSLAYLIAWAWSEHVEACRLVGIEPSERLVFLIDEPEAHLHPKWQRHLMPALLDVLTGLSPQLKPQVIATTHSPLVLASLEPVFQSTTDKLHLFEMNGGEISMRELPWAKQGDAIAWLTSDVFDLEQARSVEAERAIEAAEAFMRGDTAQLPEGLQTREAIHQALVAALPDQDRFWPRWLMVAPQQAS